MKLAIMQPYFMPYIGYFQLIQAVDAFVFYDDVNYIKSGWINRNRILINGNASYINIPQLNAGSNRLIKEVGVNQNSKAYSNLEKTIEMAYKKAPYFDQALKIVKPVLNKDYNNIAEIAIESVKACSSYLGLKTEFYVSSCDFADSKGLDKTERIFYICRKFNTSTYINAIGGMELYKKEDFKQQDIELKFIKTLPIKYKQFNNEFVPWLSILDVLMFNSAEEVNKMLDEYELK